MDVSEKSDNTIAKEVNITYETLFEILRREKSHEDLQQLHETFFDDVLDYLKDKTRMVNSNKEGIFAEDEMEKARNQLSNLKKMLRELYERREKKIISMALNKSRTNSSIINTTALLKEETALYESLRVIMDQFRADILSNMLEEKRPEIRKHEPSAGNITASQGQIQPGDAQKTAPGQPMAQPAPNVLINTKTVRFLKPVPKFVSKDLRVYGPFDEEDIAKLPEDAADLLIEKGRAEAMESESA